MTIENTDDNGLFVPDKVQAILIEDDPIWIRYFFDVLGDNVKNCFEFSIGMTLREGIETLRANQCQIIFLDLLLPDSQGVDTIKQLMAISRFTPIVVITTVADSRIRDDAMLLGVQDFLTKDQYDEKLFFHTALQAIRRSIRSSSIAVGDDVKILHRDLAGIESRIASILSSIDHTPLVP